MYSRKQGKHLCKGVMIFIFLVITFINFSISEAIPGGSVGNWAALPPYNTLWPLWSPALSPINPITGLPTPIVSNLAPGTVLPVQPGLTWDPAMAYPWLLYNTPVGMAYYDPFLGINLWPPQYLTLAPLTLPPYYSNLAPTSSLWISSFVPLANALYLKSLPKFSSLAAPTTSGFIPPLPVPFFPPITPTVITTVPPIPPIPTVALPITPIPPVPPVPITSPAAPTITLLPPSAII